MAEKIVTRFAPSPTGLLHAGNYRTAIFAYLSAKKAGGKFLVRIEDTDRERSKAEYEDNIHETLDWLGLVADETYRQSEHAPRHQELLQKLIAEDKAYVSKETPKEPGDRAEVIRFRNPKKVVTFTDVIRGDISTDTTELGDFVIAKSESEPIFHFAVVVDDADEGVTHVIRGEDHISNTPRQILICEALGFTTPTYVHLPLVLSTDRTKLSKRKGAKALTQYRDEGYLSAAVINYLALLGWHPEGEQEVFSVEELLHVFSLDRVQKSAGIFDETKLRWFNNEHLAMLSDEEFLAGLDVFMRGALPSYAKQIVTLLRERSQTFGDAKQAIEAGEYAFLEGDVFTDKELLLKSAKADAAAVVEYLTAVEAKLAHVRDEDFTTENVKEVIFPYASEVGRSAVLWPMRVALSGLEKSPDPFTLAGLLGKEKTLARITQARTMLE